MERNFILNTEVLFGLKLEWNFKLNIEVWLGLKLERNFILSEGIVYNFILVIGLEDEGILRHREVKLVY